MVMGGKIVSAHGGGVLVKLYSPLGFVTKFTPAPHIPASAGVMREGASERHSWA